MFLQEFGDHPNVIKLHNVIRAENDKDIYLVFEFMGECLLCKWRFLSPAAYSVFQLLLFFRWGNKRNDAWHFVWWMVMFTKMSATHWSVFFWDMCFIFFFNIWYHTDVLKMLLTSFHILFLWVLLISFLLFYFSCYLISALAWHL